MAHRVLSALTVLLILFVGLIPPVAAQDATPAAGFADLGLPELNITVTETGYEGIPAEIEAGRYLVTLTSEIDEGWIGFLQPTGMTPDEFLALFAGMAESPQDEASIEDAISYLMTGTPVADANINLDEDLMPVAYTPTQSFGTTLWVPITLEEPGTYAMACWFPDLSDGAPHAVHGMYSIVEVGQ